MSSASEATLSVYQTLRDKTLLVTGCTGFLGKVFTSLLLYQHPDVKRVYCLVRPRKGERAHDRFLRECVASPAFQPLRERLGGGLDAFLAEKVTVVAGDVTLPRLGLDDETLAELAPTLDIIINNAGLTDFSPPLEQAVSVNTRGPLHLLEVARRCDHAAILHTSTCYVTGKRAGEIREDEVPVGFYPRRAELALHFSAAQELEDCLQTIAHVYRQADDQERRALFLRSAREAIREENRNPEHPEVMEAELQRQRGRWVERTLKEEGNRRAAHWGWTNTYTYSKSMGEQLLWQNAGEIPFAIVRPAVVEGSMRYPSPGWNEGIVTCAPIAYLLYNGFRFVPTRPEVVMDIVPVDFVAQSTIAAAAALLTRRHVRIYQVATSHKNPVSVRRMVELSTLSNRQFYAKRTSEPRWKNLIMMALDSVAVDEDRYNRFSAPGVRRYADAVASFAGAARKSVPGPLGGLFKGVEQTARQVEKQSRLAQMILDIFLPFIHDNAYTFRSDSLANLQALLPPEEQAVLGFRPESIDWRDYWLNVAMPGLHKHVFPLIDEKFSKPRKKPYTYQDLLDLFDASTENYRSRVALQQLTADGTRRITYAQIRERALRAAGHLRAAGLQDGDRALLLSENRPEWGMAYFGILKAHGVAVPVDHELSLFEVLNIARSCTAAALITSEKVRLRLEAEGFTDALAQPAEGEGWSPASLRCMTLDALFLPTSDAEAALVPTTRPRGEELASLIFTSGTTGRPKGVMLAHRNFTSLLTSINQVFDVNRRDGFLSVLPLHHTFEFTAGLLMPISRGSTVTYLEEINSDYLNRAFSETPVTALVGVPALWQLLHRRITSEVKSRGQAAETAFNLLVTLNRALRGRFNVNPGKTIFAKVHDKFGGNIRYFISGAASLPAPILETFQGLGFEFLEGYGLTEAAPVLAVNRPGALARPGSVGRALPGVEVRIFEPNEFGVGEVQARGGNVMLGYWDNPEATAAAMTEDGWLRTGDLGRLDDKKRLYIVGRQKEMILSATGENVYPDELEELYGDHPWIEEISIVGIPDGKDSERVACLIRPAQVEDTTPEELRLEIRKHLDVQGSRLNHSQRIKFLRFTDDALPRTATRKIQRRKVAELLQAAAAEGKALEAGVSRADAWGQDAWLRDLIADLTGTEQARITLDSGLTDDLGLDSLALIDLAAGVRKQTGRDLSTDDLLGVVTPRGILQALARSQADAADAEEQRNRPLPGYSHLPPQMRPLGSTRVSRPLLLPRLSDDEIEIPSPMRAVVRAALGQAQEIVYRDGFEVQIFGRSNIPWSQNAIVIGNHASHLDMGLVKHALREWAPELATLAAADYFFDTPVKRAWFENFTNVIPMERSGSLDHSMANAIQKVRGGSPLLIFPEGTRSTNGEVGEFRQGMGYLVAAAKTGVLPIYVAGTHRAMPKGSLLPKNRRLRVYIGEYLPWSWFAEQTRDLPAKQAWARIAELTREAVLALKAGRRFLDGPAQRDVSAQEREEGELRDLFTYLQSRFVERQVDSPVAFYFSLGEEGYHKWTVQAEPTRCTFLQGKPPGGKADCVVKTDAAMFRKMVTQGYVPSIDEFVSGQVKTSDPALLMTFQTLFGF